MQRSTTYSILYSFFLFAITFNYAQDQKVIHKDSLKVDVISSVNSTNAEQGDVDFTDGTNSLIRITDEGSFGAIELKSGVPSTPTNKLYLDGTTLKFSGSPIGGAEATSIDGLSDAKVNGGSYYIGSGAGANQNTTSNVYNIGIGLNTLNTNTAGLWNIAIGMEALFSNNQNQNVSIGHQSSTNTNAISNTIVGTRANYHNISGSNNTMIGWHAGEGSSGISYSGSVFIGSEAGANELTSNKLYIDNSSTSNPLIWGDFTDGNEKVKINGDFEVTGNTSGLGLSLDDLSDARTENSSTDANVFVGFESGINIGVSSSANTALGYHSLNSLTFGSNNTAVGSSALKYNTGNTGGNAASRNSAFGTFALTSNTLGEDNTGFGTSANRYNQEGSQNTIIGSFAGSGTILHDKSGNVFIGYKAGFNEVGDDKLYIENSESASPLIWGDFANDIAAINGYFGVNTQNPTARVDVVATTGEDAFRVAIGGSTKLKVHDNGGTSVGLNASGTPANGLYVHGDLNYNAALTSVSDKRYKMNIENISNPLKKLMLINGVYYDWKRNEFPERNFTNKKQIGVIAQEVEQVFPELVVTNSEGYKSVDYVKLAPILIEAVKEQNFEFRRQNSELKQRLERLEKENIGLKTIIAENKILTNEIEILKTTLNNLLISQQQIKITSK